MTTLVTGGSGFVGRRLSLIEPDWTYISSKDCDLTDSKMVAEMFGDLKPSSIVHLAARVGGIKDNIENQADFFYINTMMNTNIIHEAYRAGIRRVLSSLSTCAFPEELQYFPFDEEQIYNGAPTVTNFSYGMTKRMLHVSSCAYRNQYDMNYSTFCPSNIYGPGDNFGSHASHFVAALVHKIHNAKENDTIEMWGTGMPLRQQLYVDDLCEIIPVLLKEHNTDVPLIVAPNENLSILEMTRTLIEQTGKNVRTLFNGNMDGQFRKDGSNEKLLKLIGPFDFTTFKEGVSKTYNWYSENYND
jgi:GDP-L-fucose synthase